METLQPIEHDISKHCTTIPKENHYSTLEGVIHYTDAYYQAKQDWVVIITSNPNIKQLCETVKKEKINNALVYANFTSKTEKFSFVTISIKSKIKGEELLKRYQYKGFVTYWYSVITILTAKAKKAYSYADLINAMANISKVDSKICENYFNLSSILKTSYMEICFQQDKRDTILKDLKEYSELSILKIKPHNIQIAWEVAWFLGKINIHYLSNFNESCFELMPYKLESNGEFNIAQAFKYMYLHLHRIQTLALSNSKYTTMKVTNPLIDAQCQPFVINILKHASYVNTIQLQFEAIQLLDAIIAHKEVLPALDYIQFNCSDSNCEETIKSLLKCRPSCKISLQTANPYFNCSSLSNIIALNICNALVLDFQHTNIQQLTIASTNQNTLTLPASLTTLSIFSNQINSIKSIAPLSLEELYVSSMSTNQNDMNMVKDLITQHQMNNSLRSLRINMRSSVKSNLFDVFKPINLTVFKLNISNMEFSPNFIISILKLPVLTVFSFNCHITQLKETKDICTAISECKVLRKIDFCCNEMRMLALEQWNLVNMAILENKAISSVRLYIMSHIQDIFKQLSLNKNINKLRISIVKISADSFSEKHIMSITHLKVLCTAILSEMRNKLISYISSNCNGLKSLYVNAEISNASVSSIAKIKGIEGLSILCGLADEDLKKALHSTFDDVQIKSKSQSVGKCTMKFNSKIIGFAKKLTVKMPKYLKKGNELTKLDD